MNKKTTISVSEETALKLQKLKGSIKDTYDIVINKLIEKVKNKNVRK